MTVRLKLTNIWMNIKIILLLCIQQIQKWCNTVLSGELNLFWLDFISTTTMFQDNFHNFWYSKLILQCKIYTILCNSCAKKPMIIKKIMWLFDFWSYLHRTKRAFLSCIRSWFKMSWQASYRRLVVCGELVFLIKIWIRKNLGI